MSRTQIAEGLNEQPAQSARGCHVPGRGAFELNRSGTHLDFTRGAVGEKNHLGGHLLRQTQQVRCIRARWLKTQPVLAFQCLDDRFDIGPQRTQHRVVARDVVQTPPQQTDAAFGLVSLQGRGYRSACAQVGEILGCEHPAGSVRLDALNDLGVDGVVVLAHFCHEKYHLFVAKTS